YHGTLQLTEVGHLESKAHAHPTIGRCRAAGGNRDPLARQDLPDLTAQAGALRRVDLDLDRIRRSRAPPPFGRHDALAGQPSDVHAPRPMYGDPAATRDETDYRVRRRRSAAPGRYCEEPIHADDQYAASRRRLARLTRRSLRLFNPGTRRSARIERGYAHLQ